MIETTKLFNESLRKLAEYEKLSEQIRTRDKRDMRIIASLLFIFVFALAVTSWLFFRNIQV